MKSFSILMVLTLLIGCTSRVRERETYTLPIGSWTTSVCMYYDGMVTPNVFSISEGHHNVFINSNRDYFLNDGKKYQIVKITPDTLVIKKLY